MIYKEIFLDKEVVIVKDPHHIPVKLTATLEKKMLSSNPSH